MEIQPELIEYSTNRLECMASELFRVRPRSSPSPPVDIEFLIENEPNVTLTIKDGLRHRHRVEGCVLKEQSSRGLHVWVDYLIYKGPWPQYNAVLAEEFAHIHLHKSLLLKVKTVEDFLMLQRHSEWHRFERDAKRFSRMFRMPSVMFTKEAERVYPALVAEHGFADPFLILKLLRNALAVRFEASPEDAQRRLLDASCNLESRTLTSVQASSVSLLPVHYAVSVNSEFQPRLFPDEEAMDI